MAGFHRRFGMGWLTVSTAGVGALGWLTLALTPLRIRGFHASLPIRRSAVSRDVDTLLTIGFLPVGLWLSGGRLCPSFSACGFFFIGANTVVFVTAVRGGL